MQSNWELTLFSVPMKHLMLKRAEEGREDWDIPCCVANTVLLACVNSPDLFCHPIAFLWSVCPVACCPFQLSLLNERLVFDVLLVSGTWCLGGERESLLSSWAYRVPPGWFTDLLHGPTCNTWLEARGSGFKFFNAPEVALIFCSTCKRDRQAVGGSHGPVA